MAQLRAADSPRQIFTFRDGKIVDHDISYKDAGLVASSESIRAINDEECGARYWR
jgi:hypothetical protein